MTTIIEPEVESLEWLDFDYTPPCESMHGCDKTAAWRVTVPCCGAVYLLCQTCLDLQWKFMEYHRMNLIFHSPPEGCGRTYNDLIVSPL